MANIWRPPPRETLGRRGTVAPALAQEELLTIDKWSPSANPVPTRPRLISALIPSLAFVAVTTTAPTPVYAGAQNCEPIAIVSFQYHRSATAAQTDTPQIATVDKWEARNAPPRLGVKRNQHLYPQPVADQLFNVPTTTTSVYVTGENAEPIAVKSFQYQAKAEPLVPIAVAATPVYITGANAEPIAISSFQYQGQAKPLVPISTVAETITLDKWAQPTEKPRELRRRRLTQYGVNVAIASEQIYSDTLFQPNNNPHPVRRFFRDFLATVRSLVTPAAAETTPVYAGSQNCEPIAIKAFQYQAQVKPLVPIAAAEVTPIYITAQAAEPIAIKTFQYQAKAQPVLVIPNPPETITFDKWAQPTNRPPDLRRRRLIQYGVNVGFGVEQIYSDTVFQQQIFPQLVRRSVRVLEVGAKSTFTPSGVVETITLDKWGQLVQQPRQDVKRRQWIYQVVAADSQLHVAPPAEIIRPDKWTPVYPNQHLRVKQPVERGWIAIDPKQLTLAEGLALKFQQPTQQPRQDVKRWQYLYQVVTSDTQLYIQPGVEIVTLDKFSPVYPNQHLRIKQPVQRGWIGIDVKQLTQPELVHLAKFQQPISQPDRRDRRVAWFQVYTFDVYPIPKPFSGEPSTGRTFIVVFEDRGVEEITERTFTVNEEG